MDVGGQLPEQGWPGCQLGMAIMLNSLLSLGLVMCSSADSSWFLFSDSVTFAIISVTGGNSMGPLVDVVRIVLPDLWLAPGTSDLATLGQMTYALAA